MAHPTTQVDKKKTLLSFWVGGFPVVILIWGIEERLGWASGSGAANFES